MAGVKFDGIEKRFGDTAAVSDFTLEIEDHEFFVLLGPSGCGKSTVLRMLAGLEDPTAGSIRIGETDVTNVAPKDRDIAMVFQSYALYPHMTVRKNIEFPLKARKLPASEREPAILEAARALDLTDYLDRKPSQLSGGQRQRVALARAIVRQPRVFLMDEPLSNLDAKLRGNTRSELIELQRKLGVTTVYVTHDQVEAMTMGHRIAIMKDGVLQQVGPPQAVYDQPANAFVAKFIGNPPMNVLEAPIADGSVHIGGGAIPLPPEMAPALADSATVQVGVRSEHVRFVEDGPIACLVSVIEELGHERHVICKLEDGQTVSVRADTTGAIPSPQSTAHLTLDSTRLHFFASVTGERLG
ncbi:MAG: ABC transporter ATP-binding protein [Acidimicrobiia bacterium]